MGQGTTTKKPLPVGVDSFREICDEGYCYVDKTLFIQEVLDAKAKVTLFTRPRRFGKSLNMNMLRVFFEKTREDTSRYFRNKRIWEQGPMHTGEQGKYPVIWLSFAGTDASTWDVAHALVTKVLQAEYRRQLVLAGEFGLRGPELARMEAFADGTPDTSCARRSLADLTEMLDTLHSVAPIILIDEYDTPIEAAWESGDRTGWWNSCGTC